MTDWVDTHNGKTISLSAGDQPLVPDDKREKIQACMHRLVEALLAADRTSLAARCVLLCEKDGDPSKSLMLEWRIAVEGRPVSPREMGA